MNNLLRKSAVSTQQQGFTLIEVLLAMAITAFIALLANSGLSTAITASEQHEVQADMIADIQLPLTVLERDIRHAVLRPVTDEYGEKVAALEGGSFNEVVLMLTRRGWDNPRGLARGDLQRVHYRIENEELWRDSWSVLDRVTEEDSQQQTLLLKGVTNFEIQFLDGGSTNASSSDIGGEWVDDWEKATLPLAIEFSFEIERFGEVRRVFSIPVP
jgi:general secretion pathway protein J